MENKKNIKENKIDKKIRIAVAMSGGVDSSVAAALVKQQKGCEVFGVFLKFWKEGKAGENACCSVESEKRARLVAKKLGIPFYVINVESEFKKEVVDNFLIENKKGNTPNPCVVCNKKIKFGILIKKAMEMGADYVATGHYVKKKEIASSAGTPPRNDKEGEVKAASVIKLRRAKDKEKDQSYFLWQLDQKQLSKVMFPIGNYKKSEVRKMAKKFDLPTASTPDSQEVCFISDSVGEFLKRNLGIAASAGTPPRNGRGYSFAKATAGEGDIVDSDGKVLGKHEGVWLYTIGQRKGIGLSGGPYYVIGKDAKRNVVVVSKDKKDLLVRKFEVRDLQLGDSVSKFTWRPSLQVHVSVRYKSKPQKAKMILDKNFKKNKKAEVVFEKPQEAITPGQSAVFYKGDELIGGGIIA